MQIELPDQLIDVLREAFTPVIDRLIDERVEQRRRCQVDANGVARDRSWDRLRNRSRRRTGSLLDDVTLHGGDLPLRRPRAAGRGSR